MMHDEIAPIWKGRQCIVAATGPSLTEGVAEQCRQARLLGTHAVLAVSDAYRLMPWADALYSCDAAWWVHHKGTDFTGVKWSSHHSSGNDKIEIAKRYGLSLVHGRTAAGFSFNPKRIHYGSNSGFQAINLAILFGAVRIVLVGFNLQSLAGKAHFFGNHPGRLQRSAKYERFIPRFKEAAKLMQPGVTIVNSTPDSALKCFPVVALEQALALEAVCD